MPAPSRPFTARHVQLSRAALAAVAALMITFSPDHSAAVGLSVFGGFAIVTAFVLALAAWSAYPAGRRWPAVAIAVISIIVGMAGSIPSWRSETLFFVLVIAWALLTGLVELLAGIRHRGSEGARDAMITGALGILLAAALLLVPAGFAQPYTVDGAGTFTLTGIILGVGLFGGYAAIVAVFLGIAGLTPRGAVERTDAAAGPRASEAQSGGPA
ncbi:MULTISPECIES: acyl-CoA synthetase [Microbacterium]|uniref:acyl-CoA synthetase n=1 Tax=Microbacterium TaxID=33882 RepID=UPI00217F0925|nr:MULTISPECIES: acyl-CoA synthetase [Microbacterium]UWF77486.1 acyl-CoA synthetase [Microbacterium neungamense]WCM55649.1 acyl-CoA synthetase [Microbacterium sp. EF45047]